MPSHEHRLDVHLGGQRPFGYGYWPLPEDDPGVELPRESIRLVTPDGALVRGLLWLPPDGTMSKTAVILSHPRATSPCTTPARCSPRRATPTCGFGTRYMDNDIDCLHESCIVDVETVAAEMRRRGAEAVVLLGNSGGGSLMAMANAERGDRRRLDRHGRPPRRGRVHAPGDRPVGRPTSPTRFSVVPELDMYDPDNGWRPWPEPCTYDRDWLARYRAAQVARVARIDAIAKRVAGRGRGRPPAARSGRQGGRRPDLARPAGPQRCCMKYLTIYRTLADPAYLDLSIDPDERPLGSLFAFPDPLDANYGRGGLARTMTARGWLSTWSGLSSHAKLADTMPKVTGPDAAPAPDGRHRDPGVAGEGDRRARGRRRTRPTWR